MIRGNGWEACVDAPTREPDWHYRWGAIASDNDKGALGASDTVSTKKRAQQKAISQCKKNGGINCELKLIYSNGCASVVSGREWRYYQAGSTRDEAITDGMRRCEQEDRECKTTYIACSHAESY